MGQMGFIPTPQYAPNIEAPIAGMAQIAQIVLTAKREALNNQLLQGQIETEGLNRQVSQLKLTQAQLEQGEFASNEQVSARSTFLKQALDQGESKTQLEKEAVATAKTSRMGIQADTERAQAVTRQIDAMTPEQVSSMSANTAAQKQATTFAAAEHPYRMDDMSLQNMSAKFNFAQTKKIAEQQDDLYGAFQAAGAAHAAQEFPDNKVMQKQMTPAFAQQAAVEMHQTAAQATSDAINNSLLRQHLAHITVANKVDLMDGVNKLGKVKLKSMVDSGALDDQMWLKKYAQQVVDKSPDTEQDMMQDMLATIKESHPELLPKLLIPSLERADESIIKNQVEPDASQLPSTQVGEAYRLGQEKKIPTLKSPEQKQVEARFTMVQQAAPADIKGLFTEPEGLSRQKALVYKSLATDLMTSDDPAKLFQQFVNERGTGFFDKMATQRLLLIGQKSAALAEDRAKLKKKAQDSINLLRTAGQERPWYLLPEDLSFGSGAGKRQKAQYKGQQENGLTSLLSKLK